MTLRMEGNRAILGSRELKLSIISPPMQDGTTHLIEGTSSPADQYMQKLFPSDLKGVLGAILPSGFEIIVYRAQGRTPGLDIISFQNLSRGRCITLGITIAFQDWTYRTNLIHFAEDIRSAIEQKLPACQSALVTKDEYGVFISVRILLGDTDDCFDLFNSSDEKLFALYKEALSNADSKFIEKLEDRRAGSDSGLRWWLRYIVVPLVSGGMGAAIVGWALLHL